MPRQVAFIQLQVEDADLTAKLLAARARIKEINAELKKNPGPERYKELVDELAKTKRNIQDLNTQQRELNKQFAALKVPKDSLAGLRIEYSQLSQKIAQLSAEERKSAFGQQLIKDAARIKKEIDGIEQSIGRFTGNVGNYKSALTGLFQSFAALGLGFGVERIIRANTELTDAVANVAKTTGLTIQEANRFREEIEKIDTRTSLADRLKIAEIGGQLGIAKEQLLEFTKSVDVLNVALGDAFGNNVDELTRIIAGLRNSLSDLRSDNPADDILKIGNALNFLESQGSATAPLIADFVGRLSGVAGPLGITSERIFGLSTALAEANVSAERGATAISRLLVELAKSPAEFAKSLNLSSRETAEFANLIKKDLVGALVFVAKKLAEGGDGTKNFAQLLDELGIGQQGAIEALGKLGGNVELVNKRIVQSAEALGGTASVYEEFDKKNNNAAAAVEKLINAFERLITSEFAQDAIAAFARALTDAVEIVEKFIQLVQSSSSELLSLGGVFFAFTRPGIEVANAMRSAAAATTTMTAATVRQTVATTAATAATRALAAAQAALPLLAVVAGIYAIVKAVQLYNDSLSASEKASRALADAQKEIADSTKEEVAAVESSFAVLKNVASSYEERAKAIKSLTDKYPELLEGIDLEKASLEQLTRIQKELTEEIIRGAAARAKARAQEEVAAKIVEQQLRVERARAAAQREQVQPVSRPAALGSAAGVDVSSALTAADRLAVEEKRLQKLREELEEVGKAFDRAFKLDKKREDFAIQVVVPEREQKNVEQVSASLDAFRSEQSEKDKKAAERLAEERKRNLEAQLSRIADIEKSIRSLRLSEEDKYKEQIIALDNELIDKLEKNRERLLALQKSISERLGREVIVRSIEDVRQLRDVRREDIQEVELIERERKTLVEVYSERRKVIEQEQQKEIRQRQVELFKQIESLREIEREAEVESTRQVVEAIKRSYEARIEQVQLFEQQQRAIIIKERAAGLLAEEDAKKREQELALRVANDKLAIEKEYAQRTSELIEQVRDVRLQAAKEELDSRLLLIEVAKQEQIQSARERARAAGVSGDAEQEVQVIEQRAIADAIAAQQKYAAVVREIESELQQLKIEGIKKVSDAQQEAFELEIAQIEELQRRRREAVEQAIELSQSFADKLLELASISADNEKSARLRAIDEEYEAKKKRAGQNAKLVERLEKEQAKKKEEIEKEAAEKRKQIAIVEAIINTAVAVTRVIYNPVLAAATAALGALQVAIIKSKQFAEGGPIGEKTKEKSYGYYAIDFYRSIPDVSRGGLLRAVAPADDTGHRVAGKLERSGAVVHEGEYVAPRWMVKRMPALFGALEQIRASRKVPTAGAFLPAFAQGGFVGVPALGQAQAQGAVVVSVNAQAQFDDEQVQAIAEQIAERNAQRVERALAEGLFDANRRLEREQALKKNRLI